MLLWLRSRHGADLVAGWSFAWAKLRRAFAVPRLPEPPLRVLLSGSTAVGGTTALSDTSPRWRADLRRTQIHDSPPAALNAGFAPHCCRSDARGLTSQIDPKLPYTKASTNGGAGVGLRTFVRPCLIPHSGANGSGLNASVCTEKLLSVFGPKVVVMAHPRHRDRRPSESGRCEGYCCAHQRRTVRHHIA